MPVNDSAQHVVRTSAQWDERAVEFWVVPRGCLCVELTPDHKTKIKIGEGNKFYSQLPYITSEGDLANYYTKTEIDNLLANLNRMAIQSTEEYDSKNDLPLTGNKLGDVRFVKSASPSIKTDPDIYVWNNTKWIYVGYDFSQIDLSDYVKKEEFEPVVEKVNEMYEIKHTHDNKEILDRVEVAFTVVDKNKLDSLENYDDTEVKNRLTNVENKAHVHNNMQILNMTTAAFTIPDKNKLDSLRNYDVFRGTNGIMPGTIGLVPAPQPADVGKVLSANGRWVDVDVAPFTGATATTDGESGLVPAPLAGQQAYYLRGDGIWAKVKTGDKYRAGDGITILSGEVISDTFPFQILPQAEQVTQYIIYGAPGGVGDAVTGGYRISINASAEGHTDRSATVIIPDKMYEGDYVDYQKQVYSTYRTNVTSRVSADPNYNYDYGIYSDGRVAKKDPGAYGGYPRVTALFELEPGASYEITAYKDNDSYKFENAMHINLYDADLNVTRTIAQSYTGNTTFTPAATDKYMRFAYREDIWSWTSYERQKVWQLKDIERPCGLPELFLYPGVVNTINATTTVKPSLMYIEVEPPDDPESEDPTSEFTGIIYNDGVLNVTQEDPNAMNELTVHFRNDTTTLILPVTEEMTGASGSTDGTGGTVPAPLAGEQTYFLRGDGVWAKVKQEGDKYKAGDGIYIMSAETVIDSFPAEFYSRSNKLKNYIIYGNTGGVGEYESTSGKYLIPIKITAEGETAVTNNIVLTAKLYPGDYIDYGNQTFVHTRTPVATPIVGRGKAIDSNGDVMSSSAYAVTQCCATDFIPVSSEFSYELTPTYDPISSYLSPRFHALYDENQVCTRTIPANYNSTIQITPAANEKYMRITGGTEYYGQVMVMPTVTQIGPVVETTLIPSIGTYPNVVNTIDILTTVKPSSVFIEATPDEEDPDDPSSAFTGIIYNEGVLDVTQEDPTALNELTVTFRNSSKVLTLPEAEEMTGATALADGTGGTVPAPLMGEENMFLRGDGTWANVPGSGQAEQYGAGAGINIIQGEASGDKFPINIASNDNYIEEYIIYGTEAGVGDYDPTTHKYVIPIAINAKDKETIRSYIYLDDPLGQGEYIVYSQQKAVKYRENILLRSGYEAGKFIADGGVIYSGDVDSQNVPISYLTGEIGLTYNERYILQGLTYDEHENSQHVFCHWIRMNDLIGQTVTYSTSPMVVPSTTYGPSNSHRINVTVLGYEDNLYKARLYHMLGTATDFQATLARITIYAGVINTLDVETTNKPDQIYVRAHVNTDPDAPPIPETWIIENTGVIDVEQDAINRNKLTFKYKDTEKVITINDAGDIYEAGPGIDISHPSETYLFAESIHLMPGDIIDTNVTPSGTQDFGAEFGFNSPSFNSFILLCYDGYEGSFSFNPNSSSAGDVSRMWIYNGHESWIDLTGESLSTNTDYEFKCTWGHNMSMQQLPSGQVYSASTAYYPIDHETVKLGYNSSETIFYYIKLYDGEELVGDFVPAVRQSDNRTGLFDRVTNTFHTNTGTVMAVGNLTGDSYVDVFPEYDISAKISEGLQFDNNDAIKVKLGTGLQFDANGAIEAIGGGTGGNYNEGDGIKFEYEPVVSGDAVTHVKWSLLQTRGRKAGSSDDCIQVQEFEMRNINDELISFKSNVTGVFVPSSTTPVYGTYQTSQTPDALVDGTSRKMCCTNFSSSITEFIFTMELTTPVPMNRIKDYRYITGGDVPNRDPVSWVLYVSTDGTNYIEVDRRIDQTITQSRSTGTSYYTPTFPSTLSTTINVQYGDGLEVDADNDLNVIPATTTTLGGIIVGSNLSIDANGVLSATGGGGTSEGNYEAGEAIKFTIDTPPILPTGYQLVDYIGSSGTQGIELNYIPGADYIKYELTFSDITFENTNFHYLVGGWSGSETDLRPPSINYNFELWPNKMVVPCGTRDVITNGEIPSDMSIPHTYTLTVFNGSVSLKLDDRTAKTGTCSGFLGQKVGLFCAPSITSGDQSAIFQTCSYRFRELKIYEGSSSSNLILIHHYYPCFRTSDDVAGVYDLVTDTFLTNVGTGDFEVGPNYGTPVINVQYGDGLEVDANNDLNVKLGSGLQFDANGAIEAPGGIEYVAGDGINIDYASYDPDYYFNTQVSCKLSGNRLVQTYTKYNSEPAFGAIIWHYNGEPFSGPVFVGRTVDSVKCTSNTTNVNGPISFDGKLWYYSTLDGWVDGQHTDDLGNMQTIEHLYPIAEKDDAALAILAAAYAGSNSKSISVKPSTTSTIGGVIVGDGLSVDQNGEISVDEMVGANSSVNGSGGIVPAPLAGDNEKFLRGDGTWAEVDAATNYVEGDAIEFGHPGMTDLGFNFDTFVSKFTEPNNGIVSVDSVNKAFTLTATGSDAYTNPWADGDLYTIPVVGGRKYRLTWNSNAPTVGGNVYVFENANTSHMHGVNQRDQNYLEFTADTTSNVNFRFGVSNSGNTITYSNIKFYEVDNADPDTNIINVKYGSGLSLDSSNRLQANAMTGADGTNAGTAGVVPAPTATDNTKFLKGDGTWSDTPTYTLPTASASTLGGIKVGNNLSIDQDGVLSATGGNSYVAGDGIEFTAVPELHDMGFNYATYIGTVQGVEGGSITKNNNESFTITSTADGAYTYPYNTGHGALYTINVEPNTKYRLTFDLSDWTVDSYVDTFENGLTSTYYRAYMPSDPYLEFTTSNTASYITFRFGVTYSGHTQTFSNIKLYRVDTSQTSSAINAKLGTGLSFDNNGAIEVDLGQGLSFDQNGSIQAPTMTGATSQAAGAGGIVPMPLAGDDDAFLRGDGTWANPPSYTLPAATTTTLGGVKVGAGLSINANDELGVTSPYVTSVTNQGSTPGVITVAKSDGTSSDVDVLDNLRLILNCNFDSSQNQTQLGEAVDAPVAGNTEGSPIVGDLTVLEV